MSESDSKQELMNCGIPVPAQAIVRSEEELKEAFRKMQLPIALKINSSEILHKTEAGGVKLNVTSVEDALLAVRQIRENVKEAMPQASTDGILLQEMAPAGVEIIIGIINDPQFGPMLLTGLGGIFVELLKDTVLYPAPINKTEAEMILKSLKTSRLLTGYRGSAPCDLEALEDLMVKISEYAIKIHSKRWISTRCLYIRKGRASAQLMHLLLSTRGNKFPKKEGVKHECKYHDSYTIHRKRTLRCEFQCRHRGQTGIALIRKRQDRRRHLRCRQR